MGTEIVEIRCPVGPRRLFAKLRQEGQKPRIDPEDNLFEVSCSDCTRAQRRLDSSVVRVLHRFNFLGQLVSSETVRGR